MNYRRFGFRGVALVWATLLLALPSPARAMVGAPPRSLQEQVEPLANVRQIVLAPTDTAKELAAEKAKGVQIPLRYAVPQQVRVTPASDGTWEDVPGGRLWRVRLVSTGATDLNLAFTNFWLPEGATLHVIAEDESYYQGPYTSRDNSESGQLWTAVVPGDAAVVELFVPSTAKEEPQLTLMQVGSGFLDLFKRQKDVSIPKEESCEIDVVCPIAAPWTNEVRSVARISIAGIYLCSGTLMADAPRDFRNFFLTANHCFDTPSQAASVVVYWNFQSPRCGEHGGGSLAENQSGAIFRAARSDVDFFLIELSQMPEASYNVYYAGWDRSGAAPQGAVGIHHPNADEKCISFSYNPLITVDSCIGNGLSTHWQVTWSQGVTEDGSSGSGIWDSATHLLVGTLSGGESDCSTPQEPDCYGKLAVAWSGGSSSSRLSDWLDPQGTGVMTVSGSNPSSGPDTVPPTIAISSPTGGRQVTSAALTVSGTARDNVGLAAVYYRVNGGSWTTAISVNNWANWTGQVTLSPGTNQVDAYAVDTSGNVSSTVSVTVNYLYTPTARLVIETSGPGTFTPNYSNAVLQVGHSYSMTVTPRTGYLFSGWTGTVLGQQVLTGSTARLTFTMQSNLVLHAGIVPNPFIPIAGAYNGLFTEAGRQQSASGFFSLSLTSGGTYSAYILTGGRRTNFTGQFDLSGNSTKVVPRQGTTPLTVSLALDLSGASDRLTGSITDGHWTADLQADLAVFSTRTKPATEYAGIYTVLIAGGTMGDATFPLGDGYATLNVTAGGTATVTGTLADGSGFSQSVPVSKSGRVPFQVSLYSGGGSILGWLAFDTNQPASSIQGPLSWIRPAQASSKLYPAGFSRDGIMATGSRYVAPTGTSSRVVGFTNGTLVIQGADLAGSLTNLVSLSAKGKVTDLSLTNKLSLTIGSTNGFFSGTLTPAGTHRVISVHGAILQSAAAGYGYFLGTNQSGLVYLGQ